MKILLASDCYNTNTSGVEGMVKNHAAALRTLGHEVKILTMSPSDKDMKDGDIYFIHSFSLPISPGHRQTFARRDPLIDELKKWKPDLIHSHTEGSAARIARIIAKSSGAPIVMTMHTDYVKYAFHQFSKMIILKPVAFVLAAYYYQKSVVITTPSEKAVKLLRSYGLKQPVCVIPNGIQLKYFQRDFTDADRKKLLAKYHIPDNGKLFVCISRLSSEKNIAEILRYFAALLKKEPNAYLLIAGDGPDRKHLESLASLLKITDRVCFTGMIPREKLYRYYKSGVAFLSASTFEIHSLTYLEALACGTPLICHDDPCLKGVLTDGETGFRYRGKEEFVKRCLELLSDKELQKHLSEGALKRSEEFNDMAYAKHTVELYEKLLD